MKFIVHWVRNPGVTPHETNRRTREIEALRPGGLKVLYTWYAIGEPEGVGIVEADDARDIAVQIARYGNLLRFTVTPALSREEWEATLATVPEDAPL